jgi:group I intron endonuclease
MIGLVYKIVNLINNKVYVGQTTRSLERRWYDHSNRKSKSCPALKAAIEKYGKQNFTIEVLEVCESLDKLNEQECFWILKLNTLSPNGYNLMTGGKNQKASEEKKKKQSDAYKDPELRSIISNSSKNNWSKPEYRELISKKRKEMWKNPEYREKMSIIRRNSHKNKQLHDKIIAGLLKAVNAKRKPVIMTDIDGSEIEFISIAEAIRKLPKLKLRQSQISQCCIGKAKTHRKRKWRFKK